MDSIIGLLKCVFPYGAPTFHGHETNFYSLGYSICNCLSVLVIVGIVISIIYLTLNSLSRSGGKVNGK